MDMLRCFFVSRCCHVRIPALATDHSWMDVVLAGTDCAVYVAKIGTECSEQTSFADEYVMQNTFSNLKQPKRFR